MTPSKYLGLLILFLPILALSVGIGLSLGWGKVLIGWAGVAFILGCGWLGMSLYFKQP